VWEIAAELARLMADGRAERLARADLEEGTFAISNIGAVSFVLSFIDYSFLQI
jgi:pyruvate/2-oxoglutarate dehydrogenase complex dihydrolipoamide acyltransferase (E2) component